MQIQVENAGALCRIRIVGEMTIYAAAELKAALVERLSDCQELDVALSDVTEMDTVGVQLLLLTKREAVRSEKAMRLTAPSPAVQAVLECYHLSAYFDDPRSCPRMPAAG